MSLLASRAIASRAIASRALARQAPARAQKRTITDYLTNYPDKLAEKQKVQCSGGILQGDKNPTWMKQPWDNVVSAVGLYLTVTGVYHLFQGFYNLANNKGKME